MNRRRRVGQTARERVRKGGKLALGRPSATREEWARVKARLRQRSGGWCEVEVGGLRCQRRAVDPCHVTNRSQGSGDGVHEVYAGCRFHNLQQAAAYARGRLVVTALGDERFRFEVVYAKDKFAARAAGATA